MEALEVLRALSLVVGWGIPVLLVLAVAVFIILASTFAFGGITRKLYEGVSGRNRGQKESAVTIVEILATDGIVRSRAK